MSTLRMNLQRRLNTTAGAGVAAAFVAAIVGAILNPGNVNALAGRVYDGALSPFRSEPPPEDRFVRRYVDEVEAAGFWTQRPDVLSRSVSYFRRNFAQLDPREIHSPLVRPSKRVLLPTLARDTPLYEGTIVATSGIVVESKTISATDGRSEVFLFVVPSSDTAAVAFVRITMPRAIMIRPGEYVDVQGLPLMSGLTPAPDAGVAPAVYLVGSHVARLPDREAVVNAYVDETRTAQIWQEPPKVFEDSVRYFKTHFGMLDPRRAHGSDANVPEPALVTIKRLVEEPELHSGKLIFAIGHISARNLAGIVPVDEKTKRRVGIWILQIKSTEEGARDYILYCRLPAPTAAQFPEKRLVFIDGVLLASGSVKTTTGGFAQAAYFACRNAIVTNRRVG